MYTSVVISSAVCHVIIKTFSQPVSQTIQVNGRVGNSTPAIPQTLEQRVTIIGVRDVKLSLRFNQEILLTALPHPRAAMRTK